MFQNTVEKETKTTTKKFYIMYFAVCYHYGRVQQGRSRTVYRYLD